MSSILLKSHLRDTRAAATGGHASGPQHQGGSMLEEPTVGETALQDPGKRSTLEPRKRKIQSCSSVPPAPSTDKIKHCATWGEMFRGPVSVFSFHRQ